MLSSAKKKMMISCNCFCNAGLCGATLSMLCCLCGCRLPLAVALASSQQVSSNTSNLQRPEAPLALSLSVSGQQAAGAVQVAAGSAHANYFGHNVLILFAFDYFCNFIASPAVLLKHFLRPA